MSFGRPAVLSLKLGWRMIRLTCATTRINSCRPIKRLVLDHTKSWNHEISCYILYVAFMLTWTGVRVLKPLMLPSNPLFHFCFVFVLSSVQSNHRSSVLQRSCAPGLDRWPLMRWGYFSTTYWVPGGVALSLCTAIMHTEHDGVRRRTVACTVRSGDEPSAANEGSATRVSAIASQGRLPGPLPRVGNIPTADDVGQAGIGHRHRECQQQEQQHGGGVSYEVVVAVFMRLTGTVGVQKVPGWSSCCGDRRRGYLWTTTE